MTQPNDIVLEKLNDAFSPIHLDLVDNSWMHAGHAGNNGGSHLAITMVSEKFADVNLIDRHRLVHDALKAEMNGQIHALELKLLDPSEWES